MRMPCLTDGTAGRAAPFEKNSRVVTARNESGAMLREYEG